MHTGCKLIVVDPERASVIEPITSTLKEQNGVVAFLVLDQSNRSWRNMRFFNKEVDACLISEKNVQEVSSESIEPEDNPTIIFTSGTSHLFFLVSSYGF